MSEDPIRSALKILDGVENKIVAAQKLAVDLEAENTRLADRVKRLEEALRPFVLPVGYGDIDTGAPDDGPIITFYSPVDQHKGSIISRGAFRRARAALEGKPDAKEGGE